MTARELALKALGAYRRNNARPDAALRGFIERYNISQRDAALAMQITGGVMQNMALCDYYIACYSSIALKKIEPRVLDILRMSIYQILLLDKVPHSAAVNEGAALAGKTANPRAVGFVNALLRKIANAAVNGSLPEIDGDKERILSVKYSHPLWLVHEFCLELGAENAEMLLVKNNEKDVPLTAQVNTLLTDYDTVIESLKSAGVKASKHEWLDDCIELRGAGNIERLDAFREGRIYIQDTASRLAVMAAGINPHDFVIDGCAAPGGKSFSAAISMKNTGRILCFDLSAQKLRLITDGAGRLGIKIICVAEKDAISDAAELRGKADVVIADVPCSGFGVIRKKPEIRYKTESDIAGLPEVQKKILTSLSAYVKPGGTLLYSTCTVFQRENESVVKWFLSGNSDFSAESFTLPEIGCIPGGMITLWPHVHGTDGFFICKMKRKTDYEAGN